MNQDINIQLLLEYVVKLTAHIEQLEKENAELRSRLQKFEHPKNSNNSSVPPSKDENKIKRTSSLRIKSGRKPGGQIGHEGNTLKMTDTPDFTLKHQPLFCNCCGSNIEHIQPQLIGKRQVVDIPKIKTFVTEHQIYQRTCSCGVTTKNQFPVGVNASVSYGDNIESLTGYFHARQYIPFGRTQEIFNDIFNVQISEGGIHCLLNRLAEKASPMYKSIQQRIQQSSVIGSDETGVKVNGKRNWFWTWQTNQLTYIAHSEKRGSEAINAHFPNGFPNSILVSDAWKPQLSTPAKHHQTCIAHLQRDIKYVNELFPKRKWGEFFANLLSKSLALKKEMSPSDYQHENLKRDKIIREFEDLLKNAPSKDDKELITLYKRMVRDKNNLFNFLFIPEVPPDNNASERAIRMVKVKQKISGQFKTSKAAQNFAIIRSIIDTTRKNNQNVIDGLLAIAKYGYCYTD